MHTLFSDNILTPSPETLRNQTNPFELVFNTIPQSHTSIGSSTATTASRNSPTQQQYLTQFYQNLRTENGDPPGTEGHHLGLPPALQPSQPVSYAKKKSTPKLAILGPRKVGKSSIHNVIFQKLPAAESLFLDPTNRTQTSHVQLFTNFEIVEVPAHFDVTTPDFDHRSIFLGVGSCIWVIDVQDEYLADIGSLVETAVFLAQRYPRVNLDVFIHKTDGLSEEYKQDTFRDIRQRVSDELSDVGYGDRPISYYQTSIFDHSVNEAMSKVIQKLLPQLPYLESLLNRLCSTCKIQKAYLFDTHSKIYIATDTSPTFLKDFEVCSDWIDVIVDIKEIYRDHSKDTSKKEMAEGAEPSMGEALITMDKTGDNYLYAKEINDYLSLVCLMGKGSKADMRPLVDYNAMILQEALLEIFGKS
ncbi:ras-related GTP-binding protein-like protein C [Polychaeton citri CBS 116435]|uniref:GTP-binding protein n=1 Tax=Polychaeton citri CBS 116435 TaxID=1314669 RepID=A0A9P4QJK6_9PEZI|nr:ras-related GTP-binding protein-like protein C [Polychaeton citri CBS 116435]